MSDKLIGQTIAGRYEVKRLLGQGGMGAVYEATQQPLGRRVALKVIKRALTDDDVAVRRFTQEAQAVALSHPHIVTLHDFGQTDDGLLFLAMEFLDGESLRERLAKTSALPWQRTLPVIVEVCQALSHAHEAGIIHRDLKPDNVMLVKTKGRDDYVKVVDFGVAKLLEGSKEQATLTGTGMAVGTPGYIAPEQLDGVGDDPRIDLYALGVIWFEMLTGSSPFVAETPLKLVLKHMSEPAPRPSSLSPETVVPPTVDMLVQRLMGKKPDARAPNVDALLAEVEALWAHAGALPPEAGTAALSNGELDAIRARSPTPTPTPTPTPVTAQPTPAGETPSTAGVVVPVVDAVTPKKKQKSRVGRYAAIGCLLFMVPTCGLCLVVGQQAKQDVEDFAQDMESGEALMSLDAGFVLQGPNGGRLEIVPGPGGSELVVTPPPQPPAPPRTVSPRPVKPVPPTPPRAVQKKRSPKTGGLDADWRERAKKAARDIQMAISRRDEGHLEGALETVYEWDNAAARRAVLTFLETERRAVIADPQSPERLKQGFAIYERAKKKAAKKALKKAKRKRGKGKGKGKER